eukprot:10369516-Alexandrium_andersonii.AAC.1
MKAVWGCRAWTLRLGRDAATAWQVALLGAWCRLVAPLLELWFGSSGVSHVAGRPGVAVWAGALLRGSAAGPLAPAGAGGPGRAWLAVVAGIEHAPVTPAAKEGGRMSEA